METQKGQLQADIDFGRHSETVTIGARDMETRRPRKTDTYRNLETDVDTYTQKEINKDSPAHRKTLR